MKAHNIAPQGTRHAFLTIACLLTALPGLDPAHAEAWPSKTVTAIAPFAAGSAADVMARVALDQISKQVGRPIIVENRVGAGGTLGANVVAKAAPDGYTILAHSSSLAAAHGLYRTLPYDTLQDLAPVIPLGLQPMVLVTAPAKGWKTLGDLVAAAKAKDGATEFRLGGRRLGISPRGRATCASAPDSTRSTYRSRERWRRLRKSWRDAWTLRFSRSLRRCRLSRMASSSRSPSARRSGPPLWPMCRRQSKPASPTRPMTSGSACSCLRRLRATSVSSFIGETERALQTEAVRVRLAKLGVEPMPMSREQFDAYFREDVAAHVRIVKAADIIAPQ